MAASIDPVEGVRGSRDGDSLRKDTLSALGDKVAETASHDVGEDETPYVVDKTAERALTRKFDLRLMPVLAIMVRRISNHPVVCHCVTCEQYNTRLQG